MLTPPRPALVALCGMPGSGKSTAAEQVVAGRVIHVSVDDCRAIVGHGPRDQRVTRDAFNLAYEQGRDAMEFSSAIVLFDSTAISRPARASLKRYAQRCKAPIYLVVFPLEWEQVLERNTARDEGDRVPESKLRSMYKDYEALDPVAEGFDRSANATSADELRQALTSWRLT